MAALSKANLFRANLTKANLFRADLGEANLSVADLAESDLSAANLAGTSLHAASLSGANLSGANLSGADLSAADLYGANLSEANLARAELFCTNLAGATLTGANLDETSLSETIFGGTNLTDAKLDTCNHLGPSTVDHLTFQLSGGLPTVFLRGCGLPDSLIEYLPSLLNRAIDFYSCFISYNHTDKSFARRLHDQLQGQGIRCWLDDHQMLPGDDIFDEIDRGIRIWDKVLLCCSEASLAQSPWVNREIDKALQKEKRLWEERGKDILALIPLDLDGYLFRWDSGKASELQRRLAADFRGWETDNAKFEEQFERVVKALRADEGARGPAPKPKL